MSLLVIDDSLVLGRLKKVVYGLKQAAVYLYLGSCRQERREIGGLIILDNNDRSKLIISNGTSDTFTPCEIDKAAVGNNIYRADFHLHWQTNIAIAPPGIDDFRASVARFVSGDIFAAVVIDEFYYYAWTFKQKFLDELNVVSDSSDIVSDVDVVGYNRSTIFNRLEEVADAMVEHAIVLRDKAKKQTCNHTDFTTRKHNMSVDTLHDHFNNYILNLADIGIDMYITDTKPCEFHNLF